MIVPAYHSYVLATWILCERKCWRWLPVSNFRTYLELPYIPDFQLPKIKTRENEQYSNNKITYNTSSVYRDKTVIAWVLRCYFVITKNFKIDHMLSKRFYNYATYFGCISSISSVGTGNSRRSVYQLRILKASEIKWYFHQ